MNIKIKEVLDEDGVFSHVELWQGNNVIELSVGSTTFISGRRNDRWNKLKIMIDEIAERRFEEAKKYGQRKRI